MPNAYALHPWLWSDSEQAHIPPPGAGAVLDLRPEAEQAKASQSSGWGLFAWPDQVYDESGELVANMHAVPLDAISRLRRLSRDSTEHSDARRTAHAARSHRESQRRDAD